MWFPHIYDSMLSLNVAAQAGRAEGRLAAYISIWTYELIHIDTYVCGLSFCGASSGSRHGKGRGRSDHWGRRVARLGNGSAHVYGTQQEKADDEEEDDGDDGRPQAAG